VAKQESDQDKLRSRARNNAYLLLRIRPRSEREVRDRLKSKGYEEDIVEGIVAELKRSGDIDDAKFARFWLESRMHLNPVGDVVLKHELKRRGIADSIISDTLAHKAESYDEYAIALPMAQERFSRLKKLDRRKALKRVYDFLLRRGFRYGTVQRIIGELA
jgi:regulatory protein